MRDWSMIVSCLIDLITFKHCLVWLKLWSCCSMTRDYQHQHHDQLQHQQQHQHQQRPRTTTHMIRRRVADEEGGGESDNLGRELTFKMMIPATILERDKKGCNNKNDWWWSINIMICRLGRGRRLARIETDDDDNFNLGKIQQKHLKVPGNESDKDSNDDDDECGPDCRNLLHELGHPREQSRCSGSGQVIDIWGYCR